jgi:integrase/recombinase XerD
MTAMTLPALIQRFFTDRLCVQMEASRHTIASYRDTFRLLLRYAGARLGKPPVAITVEDIDVDLVADFLAHTEATRGNCARSRNTRLAAIRSFFRYVAMTDPTWMLHCQRILAMPNKRYVKRAVTFLDASEIAALLAAPDRSTWVGKRDHALLLLAVQTGLRASELISLRNRDVVLGTGAHVRCRTGHATRLGRDQTGSFGSKDYGREELVAEMAGAFVCAALGIVPSVRHADYIGSCQSVSSQASTLSSRFHDG